MPDEISKYVTHVIFDMDGLLLDTEKIYKYGIKTVMNKYGCEYTDEIRVKHLGRTPADMLNVLFQETMLAKSGKSKEEIWKEMVETFEPLMSSPEWMPGALRLIHHLKAHNVPFAIATSSSLEGFQLKTSRYKDILKLFHHVVLGAADPAVKRGKPAPDIYLVAAKRFDENPEPGNCLVFEDAPNGMLGVKEAGMIGVLVPDPIIPNKLTLNADLVLDSLEDFRPEDFGLPAFEDVKKGG